MADKKVKSVLLAAPEKRREDGTKYYVYRIDVTYASGRTALVWRRYSQFDALHATVADVLHKAKAGVKLPRLTSKRYLARSAVRAVADNRLPKLQTFLTELIAMAEQPTAYQPVLASTLYLFLMATAEDEAHAVVVKAAAALAAPPGATTVLSPAYQPQLLTSSAQHPVAQVAPVFSAGGVYTALFDYAPQNSDELPLRAGLAVVIAEVVTEDWLRARAADGALGIVTPDGDASGLIPANYLDPIPPRPKLSSPAEELLATERTHVAMLEDVRDAFFPKLRLWVSAAEAKTLFGHWNALVPASRALLAALEQGVGPAAALAEGLPQLAKPYGAYCAGVPAAQQLYDRKLGEREFVAFEAAFPALNKPTLNYLLRPVQRIMKYPLLIAELLKDQALPAHARAQLAAALEAATELALSANRALPAARLGKIDISGPVGGMQADATAAVAADAASTEEPSVVTAEAAAVSVDQAVLAAVAAVAPLRPSRASLPPSYSGSARCSIALPAVDTAEHDSSTDEDDTNNNNNGVADRRALQSSSASSSSSSDDDENETGGVLTKGRPSLITSTATVTEKPKFTVPALVLTGASIDLDMSPPSSPPPPLPPSSATSSVYFDEPVMTEVPGSDDTAPVTASANRPPPPPPPTLSVPPTPPTPPPPIVLSTRPPPPLPPSSTKPKPPPPPPPPPAASAKPTVGPAVLPTSPPSSLLPESPGLSPLSPTRTRRLSATLPRPRGPVAAPVVTFPPPPRTVAPLPAILKLKPVASPVMTSVSATVVEKPAVAPKPAVVAPKPAVVAPKPAVSPKPAPSLVRAATIAAATLSQPAPAAAAAATEATVSGVTTATVVVNPLVNNAASSPAPRSKPPVPLNKPIFPPRPGSLASTLPVPRTLSVSMSRTSPLGVVPPAPPAKSPPPALSTAKPVLAAAAPVPDLASAVSTPAFPLQPAVVATSGTPTMKGLLARVAATRAHDDDSDSNKDDGWSDDGEC